MLLFMQKKNDDADKAGRPPAEASAPQRDFIPYHCHIGPETLLTKNGELMQIIHISGKDDRDYENGSGDDVRDTIRAAITGCASDEHLAFWIHTVRRRIPIQHQPQFKEKFPADLHAAWERLHPWKYQYRNDIYITLLHDGQSTELFDRKTLPQVALPWRNRRFRNTYLEGAHERLSAISAAMLQTFAAGHYEARLLSLEERVDSDRPVVHSAPMEFLHYLINLREEPRPLPAAELGAALTNHQVTFGFNAVEAKNVKGQRRFAALLSLKQYREMPPIAIDRLMQMPMEFVVSQAFHFVPATKALAACLAQKELFDFSGDQSSLHACGIDDMLRADRGNPTDFGEQQTSIMLMADDFKLLDSESAAVQAAFARLGLVAVREDVKLEECFWAQLPGNFEFLRRREPVATAKIGGFCALNRFPIGSSRGNHWGNALALLPAMNGAPCFFNFHHHDNGHTALLDFNAFHDPFGYTLLNFLLSEARQYDGRIFVFDRNHATQLLIGKLNGTYYPEAPRLNPFVSPDSPRQRAFLLAWFAFLLSPSAPLIDAQKEALKQAIAFIYESAPSERNLQRFALRLAEMDTELAQKLAPWHGSGKRAGLIDGAEDAIDMQQAVYGFDLTTLAARPDIAVPLFACLIQRIIATLDGRPTIIVLHEAWDLIENEFFAPRIESLMEMLKEQNTLIVFATGKPLDCADAQTFGIVMNRCASHLYVPDDVESDYAAVGLSDEQARLMSHLERQKGDFLLRQDGGNVALKADTATLSSFAVLAGDSKSLAVAGTYG